jgi:hypothetical protein
MIVRFLFLMVATLFVAADAGVGSSVMTSLMQEAYDKRELTAITVAYEVAVSKMDDAQRTHFDRALYHELAFKQQAATVWQGWLEAENKMFRSATKGLVTSTVIDGIVTGAVGCATAFLVGNTIRTRSYAPADWGTLVGAFIGGGLFGFSTWRAGRAAYDLQKHKRASTNLLVAYTSEGEWIEQLKTQLPLSVQLHPLFQTPAFQNALESGIAVDLIDLYRATYLNVPSSERATFGVDYLQHIVHRTNILTARASYLRQVIQSEKKALRTSLEHVGGVEALSVLGAVGMLAGTKEQAYAENVQWACILPILFNLINTGSGVAVYKLMRTLKKMQRELTETDAALTQLRKALTALELIHEAAPADALATDSVPQGDVAPPQFAESQAAAHVRTSAGRGMIEMEPRVDSATMIPDGAVASPSIP